MDLLCHVTNEIMYCMYWSGDMLMCSWEWNCEVGAVIITMKLWSLRGHLQTQLGLNTGHKSGAMTIAISWIIFFLHLGLSLLHSSIFHEANWRNKADCLEVYKNTVHSQYITVIFPKILTTYTPIAHLWGWDMGHLLSVLYSTEVVL